MDKPLVTITTVTRNRSELLGRCIRSIQAQTYTNFEHIIVDGASTDSTDEVVASFNDPRIKYIKLNENLSLRESKRIALNMAKGKYYCMLDDDDEYLPTKIEKQVDLLESLPDDYGFVVCWMTYYDAVSGKKLSEHKPQVRGYVLEDVVEEPTISGTPTFFFRMDVYKAGYDDVRITGIGSDWATGAKYCEKWKVDYVPESLVNVYVNHGHTRMSENDKYYKNFLEKDIVFANYFLNTYKSIFDKNPQKSKNHVKSLVGSYFKLGRVKEGLPYYFKLLKLDFTLKNLIRPIYGYTYYLRHGRNKQK